MRTKAVVIVIDDLINLSKKRRPSWCQWGREMEGIVKETSFSHCVEHVNLWIKKNRPSWCQSGREMEGLWRKVVLVVLKLSRKKRPSWCQQGKEMEGIVNENLVLRWERNFFFFGYFYLWGYVAPMDLGVHQCRDVCRIIHCEAIFILVGGMKILWYCHTLNFINFG